MKTPAVLATIERRILVNYRVDAEVLAKMVPSPFRPVVVDGCGIAGICLIRLGDIRPKGLPAALGVTTENAAHRVAVEWDSPTGTAEGVLIPRRDTSSALVGLMGGRVFPGWHHRAHFRVEEEHDRWALDIASFDGDVSVGVKARRSSELPPGSVFSSMEVASEFFRAAPVGYSCSRTPGLLEGVALETDEWRIEPLTVEELRSSFFESPNFPKGSAEFDSAFLMTGIYSVWNAVPSIRFERQPSAALT
ncbi:MAG: DUF2071 domain-containing protein [Actinomycetota bacterium]